MDTTVLQAIVLGVVQGLGEFLPISSSAHLIVLPWLLGWNEHGLAFDVALHVGTLVAVLVAFARDWGRVVSATLGDLRRGRPFSSRESQLLGIIVLASVPAAIAGLTLESEAERAFRSPVLVALTMTLLGVVLLVADRRAQHNRSRGPVSLREGLLIGCAQALAIVPGVSRSGATITAALLLGHRREDAARFSFLLATPAIVGAAVLKAPEILSAKHSHTILLGVAVSAIVGLLSIRLLLGHVRTKDYLPFVYYRWFFAAVVVVALLLGWKVM